MYFSKHKYRFFSIISALFLLFLSYGSFANEKKLQNFNCMTYERQRTYAHVCLERLLSKIQCDGPYKGKKVSQIEIKSILEKHQKWFMKYGWEYDSELARNDPLKANLCLADLSGLMLNKANLYHANLQGAVLSKTQLEGAMLLFSDLRYTDFTGSDLSDADLRNSDIRFSVLFNVNLRGADLQNTDLSESNLSGSDIRNAKLNNAVFLNSILHEVNMENSILESANFSSAALPKANLSKAYLKKADFTKASLYRSNLQEANLGNAVFDFTGMARANFANANLMNVSFKNADLRNSDFTNAELKAANFTGAKLTNSIFRGSKFIGTELEGSSFQNADISDALFEPESVPKSSSLSGLKGITKARFNSESAFVTLRNALRKGGLRDQEREATYVIEKWITDNKSNPVEKWFRKIFFEYTAGYGFYPGRPLRIIIAFMLVFWCIYVIPLSTKNQQTTGIYRSLVNTDINTDKETLERLSPDNMFSIILCAGYFSLLSAFHIGWRELNIGSWITRMQPYPYTMQARGWVRSVSGFQSLISVYLLAFWALTYFGRPFG